MISVLYLKALVLFKQEKFLGHNFPSAINIYEEITLWPFLRLEFNYLKATLPLKEDSSLFTTKFPGVPGTQLIDLVKTKGWVDLGTTIYSSSYY